MKLEADYYFVFHLCGFTLHLLDMIGVPRFHSRVASILEGRSPDPEIGMRRSAGWFGLFPGGSRLLHFLPGENMLEPGHFYFQILQIEAAPFLEN